MLTYNYADELKSQYLNNMIRRLYFYARVITKNHVKKELLVFIKCFRF